MKSFDQRPGAELEAGVPLVGALLGLVEALDELEERVLRMTVQDDSLPLAVCDVTRSGSAACSPEGDANLRSPADGPTVPDSFTVPPRIQVEAQRIHKDRLPHAWDGHVSELTGVIGPNVVSG